MADQAWKYLLYHFPNIPNANWRYNKTLFFFSHIAWQKRCLTYIVGWVDNLVIFIRMKICKLFGPTTLPLRISIFKMIFMSIYEFNYFSHINLSLSVSIISILPSKPYYHIISLIRSPLCLSIIPINEPIELNSEPIIV